MALAIVFLTNTRVQRSDVYSNMNKRNPNHSVTRSVLSHYELLLDRFYRMQIMIASILQVRHCRSLRHRVRPLRPLPHSLKVFTFSTKKSSQIKPVKFHVKSSSTETYKSGARLYLNRQDIHSVIRSEGLFTCRYLFEL